MRPARNGKETQRARQVRYRESPAGRHCQSAGGRRTPAAGKVAAAARQSGDLSQAFSLIPPPGFLAAAHQAIVSGLATSEAALTVLGEDLRTGASASGDQRVVGSLDRSAALQTQWKGALLAAAKQYGVTIPWEWGVAAH